MVVLPAPLGPRKAKTSPRLDLEVDAADRLEVAVGLAQARDGDDRRSLTAAILRAGLPAPILRCDRPVD